MLTDFNGDRKAEIGALVTDIDAIDKEMERLRE